MDKATTASILGTILGLVAGIGGMLLFSPQSHDDPDQSTRMAQLARERDDAKADRDKARDDLNKAGERLKLSEKTARDLADELDRKAEAKGEAGAEAKEWKDKYDRLKTDSDEAARLKDARIGKLEAVLDKHGIYEYLSDAEIAARIEKLDGAFATAFAGRDKKAAMQALWDLQKLGPKAYAKAIEEWTKLANDFGLEPFGEGPGEMGLTMQDYSSLISDFGLVQYGLTSPDVDQGFKIASLYGLPWWSNEDASKRAEMAGNALLRGDGYTSVAAVTALRDISDPSTVRYLTDYLTSNSDNPAARKSAVEVLARKNTNAGWAAIKDASQSDPDDGVKQAAQQALQQQNPEVAGVLVTWVGENSQAALAGIKTGDIITRYNGVEIKTIGDVNSAKTNVKSDQSVQVVVHRDHEDVTLTLGPGQIGIKGVAVTPKK